MKLVMFLDAIEHVSRNTTFSTSSLDKLPLGNALLPPVPHLPVCHF